MSQSPRELVRRSLRFEHPERAPRRLWLLPWAASRHAAAAAIQERFPSDFGVPENAITDMAEPGDDALGLLRLIHDSHFEEWELLEKSHGLRSRS